jgi:ankyrin repeat protein
MPAAPPHFQAVIQHHLGAVDRYLREGGNVNVRENRQNQTMLHYAATGGANHIVNYLLSKKATVNAKDKRGMTPLMLAAQGDRPNIVRALLNKGASINAKDERGRTALMLAALVPAPRVVWLLIDRGAKVHLKSNTGQTALHYTPLRPPSNAHRNVIRQLMNKEAFNLFAKSNEGKMIGPNLRNIIQTMVRRRY